MPGCAPSAATARRPPAALRAALMDSSAPVRDEMAAVVAQSCENGRDWTKTRIKLHRLARRWRSPILATLADAFSEMTSLGVVEK